jgi:hypothetical protein
VRLIRVFGIAGLAIGMAACQNTGGSSGAVKGLAKAAAISTTTSPHATVPPTTSRPPTTLPPTTTTHPTTTSPSTTTTPPTTAPPVTAAPVGCHPISNENTCYEPGEFCRDSDHGAQGVAGDGKAIVCTDNDGWRWEPE